MTSDRLAFTNSYFSHTVRGRKRRRFLYYCPLLGGGGGGGGGGGYLEGRSAGNDLNQLAGDDGLARAVERDGQLVNHLTYRGEKNSIVRNSVDDIAAFMS